MARFVAPLLTAWALCASWSWGAESSVSPSGASKVDFNRDIRPLLAEHCLRCHGPDKAEAGLNLATRSGALAKLDSGQLAIVVGQAGASELVRRITATDPDEQMPPDKERLKAGEIELLRRWIDQGAEYQNHWAFRPLAKPHPPAVRDPSLVRSPLDQFIVARLEQRGIKPSPEADRHTLIKRLYFDLLGLLPDPAEVEQFVSAKSPRAYEDLVDRLLASPHFGERWGRHWLDMARYADSDGYEKDRTRADAYVFRDWVIEALNDDMPFDRFTIEQLAGDLLPRAKPRQLLATAFNRQTLTNEEGGVDQEEYRINAVFDRTETVGTVWLGLSVGCARCHNHKYDPIAQREYYQLFAFFNGADEVNVKLPVKATDMDRYEDRVAPLVDALAARKKELAPLQYEWEVEQRELLDKTKNAPLAVKPLEIEWIKSSGVAKFDKQSDGSYLVTLASAQQAVVKADELGETYTLSAKPTADVITGFRIEALADDRLPKKGPGRSSGGNFVVNRVRVHVTDVSGKRLRHVDLVSERTTADVEQTGFKAADVLSEKVDSKKGWAVGEKVGAAHYLQLRVREPLNLAGGERIEFVIDQQYGRQHTIGRVRVSAVTGDARGLHLPPTIVTALDMYPEKRVAATKQALFDYYAGQDETVRKLEAEIAAVQREFQTEFMPVRTIATSLRGRKTHRFERGDFLTKAEEVQPSTLKVLPALNPDGAKPTRLDLARWLVSDANPLTPRVAANHIWSHLFGAGLVRTINDFGTRGDAPSHPELLDWLATTYQRDLKWSTKGLIKLMVMSATYRQSSAHRGELVEIDPLNVLLHRQNRLRVEGEIVRDLALAAGGLLSPKIGGPSVFPPMPADLAKLSYANNFSWTDSKGEDRYRRGMYTFFKRTIPHPTLMTFDCPDSNVACVNRTVSNTPLQALTLLNNESFVEAAQALAVRLLSAPALADRQRLAAAWRDCLVRPADDVELDRFVGLLETARGYYASHGDEAAKFAGKNNGTAPAQETAAWIATVRVLLNLDEFITRE